MNPAAFLSQDFKRVVSVAFCIALVACGGGDPEASQSSSEMVKASKSQVANQLDSIQSSATVPINNTADPRSTAQAVAVDFAEDTNLARGSTQATANSILQPCKLMRFSSSFGCIGLGKGPGDYYDGLTGDSIPLGPLISQCKTVSVGDAFIGLTPSPGNNITAGNYVCYQFLLTSQTTVPIQVTLPVGTTGLAEFYIESSNTAGFKLAESWSPANPLTFTNTNTNARMVLMVRTDNGAANNQMGVGIGVSAPTPSINDTLANATVVAMNKTITGTIPVPGSSQRYYFYQQKSDQTTQELAVTFTRNQTATYRVAQRTGPATYVAMAEIVIPQAQSGVTQRFTTDNAANSAGTAAPYGIMVKVAGANAAAPANEAFSIRVASGVNSFDAISLSNTENISRWYPISGALQVATYVTELITVKDENGAPLPGELVSFKIEENIQSVPKTNAGSQITDSTGSLAFTYPLAACSGVVESANNYGPYGSPRDHYNGTAQRGMITAFLPNSADKHSISLPFTRICKETYLGYY